MGTLATLPPDAVAIFWFFFYVSLVVTAGFVFSQLYHWLRFGFMYPLVFIMMPIYLVGVVVLIGGMLVGISSI
ncbi:hypothetical protein EPO56_00440 [Patescibacteria group bacterium]|nr:MAG: hypothetical protein EPO56_00440 [Patescibacteria group bacterium]